MLTRNTRKRIQSRDGKRVCKCWCIALVVCLSVCLRGCAYLRISVRECINTERSYTAPKVNMHSTQDPCSTDCATALYSTSFFLNMPLLSSPRGYCGYVYSDIFSPSSGLRAFTYWRTAKWGRDPRSSTSKSGQPITFKQFQREELRHPATGCIQHKQSTLNH